MVIWVFRVHDLYKSVFMLVIKEIAIAHSIVLARDPR